MSLSIRKANIGEIDQLMLLFEKARQFMRSMGNLTQWINGYPNRDLIISEIANNHCFVCLDMDGEMVACFCFIEGDDPTYHYIEEGAWLNTLPYGTIHRLASNGKIKNITQQVVDWCWNRLPNLRADTHADNKTMQKALLRCGFQRCGIIYVADGSPRIAYQSCDK